MVFKAFLYPLSYHVSQQTGEDTLARRMVFLLGKSFSLSVHLQEGMHEEC